MDIEKNASLSHSSLSSSPFLTMKWTSVHLKSKLCKKDVHLWMLCVHKFSEIMYELILTFSVFKLKDYLINSSLLLDDDVIRTLRNCLTVVWGFSAKYIYKWKERMSCWMTNKCMPLKHTYYYKRTKLSW